MDKTDLQNENLHSHLLSSRPNTWVYNISYQICNNQIVLI